MKQATTALIGSTPLGAAVRIGENVTRLGRGERARARAALPHNRRESWLGSKEIDRVDDALARLREITPDLRQRVRGAMWERRRRPPAGPERKAFMIMFGKARDRAHDLIWQGCPQPRTACDVYDTICHRVGWHTEESSITRRELAARCRITPREVSRHTTALAKLGLIGREDDGRGVRYVVLPVEELGWSVWRGDQGSALDAAGEAAARRDQLELLS